MRNGTAAGIVVVLLCGSAWAQNSAAYRTVREICLFSSFLAPAESPIALRSFDIFGDTAGYDLVHDFETPSASNVANIFRSVRSVVIAAEKPLKGVYELPGYWRSPGRDARERLFGTADDWTNFVLSGGDGTDGGMNFTVSSVPALGVEHNGFVAGFNLKFY